MSLDLMSGSEVQKLLGGISVKTLQRYRLKHWTLGIHYMQPVQRCQYNRPLIEDWIVNRHEPQAHNRAIEAWVFSQQGNQRRGRKAS